jgi:hypothetical protein
MSSESGNFLPKVARKWQKCGNDLPLKKVIDSNSRYFRKKKNIFLAARGRSILQAESLLQWRERIK